MTFEIISGISTFSYDKNIYINITKLCKSNNMNFSDYKKKYNNRKVLRSLKNITPNKIIINSDYDISGVYYGREVSLIVAKWIGHTVFNNVYNIYNNNILYLYKNYNENIYKLVSYNESEFLGYEKIMTLSINKEEKKNLIRLLLDNNIIKLITYDTFALLTKDELLFGYLSKYY